MTHEFNKLFKELRNAKLTASEKLLMRNNLEFLVAEYPAKAPLSIRITDAFHETINRIEHSGIHAGSPFAVAFALVLVVGVGTSFAASDALPGDTLYPVKITVNEGLESVLAISNESKAKLHVSKVTRRLEEAETLAAVGRLTPAVRAEIEENINKTGNEFDAAVIALAEDDNQLKVAEVQSDLEASLTGHIEVLASLSTSLPESRPTIAKILASVKTRADISQIARTDAEDAVAERRDDSVRTLAIEKKKEANTIASKSRKETAREAPPAIAMSMMATEVRDDEEHENELALEDGNQKFDAGEYGGALNSFQAVIRAAKTEDVRNEAEERLNVSLSASTTIATSTATSTPSATTTEPVSQ